MERDDVDFCLAKCSRGQQLDALEMLSWEWVVILIKRRTLGVDRVVINSAELWTSFFQLSSFSS